MWGGDDTVDEEFCQGEIACWGGGRTFIGDAVAAHGKTETMGFRFKGSNGGDDATVGDLAAFWMGDVGVVDKGDGVGAFGRGGRTPLGEAGEFIGIGVDPSVGGWASDEGAVG